MTNNTTPTNNSSGWVTTSGSTEDNGSSLINKDAPRSPQAVVGKGGIEVIGTGPVKHDQPASYTMGQEGDAQESL